MAAERVLVIGCGIAGPVVAILLQKKGYKPIILEKVLEMGDAGASLMLMPNGMKVLDLIGLASAVSSAAPHAARMEDRTHLGGVLGGSSLPAAFEREYGQPGVGVKRTALNLMLRDAAVDAGIEVVQGWSLSEIEETEDGVVAVAEDGRRVEGAFVVGCDGLKSATRRVVLQRRSVGQETPAYTGLTQTAGMSPTPASLHSAPGVLNIFGPSAHMIVYHVSPDTVSWALTERDLGGASESWKVRNEAELAELRRQLLAKYGGWAAPVPELIASAQRIIKFGLYDRPELQPHQWYDGRKVLLGDAAHPTSPHLGQGANQAFEDCYHFTKLLPDFNGTLLSTDELTAVFRDFSQLRQPRTSELVRGARAQGELRVANGDEAVCEARNQRVRAAWANDEAVKAKYDKLLLGPFKAVTVQG